MDPVLSAGLTGLASHAQDVGVYSVIWGSVSLGSFGIVVDGFRGGSKPREGSASTYAVTWSSFSSILQSSPSSANTAFTDSA